MAPARVTASFMQLLRADSRTAVLIHDFQFRFPWNRDVRARSKSETGRLLTVRDVWPKQSKLKATVWARGSRGRESLPSRRRLQCGGLTRFQWEETDGPQKGKAYCPLAALVFGYPLNPPDVQTIRDDQLHNRATMLFFSSRVHAMRWFHRQYIVIKRLKFCNALRHRGRRPFARRSAAATVRVTKIRGRNLSWLQSL